MLSFGIQQHEADSLARRLLEQAEARYGTMSLQAADAIDLLVWVVNSYIFYSPFGVSKDLERVQPLVARAVTIRDSLLAFDDPRRAASLDNMATVARIAGERERADSLARVSLNIRTRAYGRVHPETARSLRLLGDLALADSSFEKARQLYEQALEIQDRTLDPQDLDLLPTLECLKYALDETAAWEDTAKIALHRRAFEIADARLGPRQARTLVYLEGLAQILGTVAPDEARQLYQQGIEAANAVFGPWGITMRLHVGYAELLEPDSALRLMRSVAPQFSQHPYFLFAYGAAAGAAADYGEATKLLTQAVRMLDQRPDSWHRAWVRTERARHYMSLGAYVEAGRDLDSARAIFESRPVLRGDAAKIFPSSLQLLAELKMRMGEFEEARDLFERMIAAQDRARMWTEVLAMRRTAYGGALAQMGDPEAALEQLLLARDLFEVSTPPGNIRALDNLYALADLYVDMREHESARQTYERCLAAQESTLGVDHPSVARTLTGLARLQLEEGRLIVAREQLERAISLLEQTYGMVHPQVAQSLALLAKVELAAGNEPLALAAAIRAEEASREHLRLTARAISERRALAYAGMRSPGLDYALAAASTDSEVGAVRTAWDALIRSRGLLLDELAARRHAIDVAGDAVAESLAKELRWARNQVANLAVRGLERTGGSIPASRASPAPTREYLQQTFEDARERKELIEEALAERSLPFRETLVETAIGYEQVMEALPPDAALVAFIRHDIPLGSRGPPLARDGRSRYSALVRRPGTAEPVLIALGSSGEIEGLVAQWQEAAGPNGIRAVGDAEQRCRSVGSRLRQKVWDPVESALAEAKRVFIVPDGAIHMVSFATLPSDEGSYLVEKGPVLHYLSTERDLARRGEDLEAGSGLLAVGGPAFDETSLFAGLRSPRYSPDSVRIVTPRDLEQEGEFLAYVPTRTPRCGTFRSLVFTPLDEAAREAAEVGQLWNRSLIPDGAAPVVAEGGHGLRDAAAEILTGAEANERAFKTHAAGHHVLHVATHGFFLGDTCGAGLRGRGMGTVVATADPLPTVVGENPLLLSGLALAGANHRDAAAADEEDGILTAEEIASLDLSGVEWAVLSACKTGVGEVRAGEGVFGLRRAFQVAGARTLIMSLWSVEDEATRAWMTELYRARLERGLDTAESVRAASLAVLKARRAKGESTHPFYWGAFVAAGDWR